jgi:hypothetical protein
MGSWTTCGGDLYLDLDVEGDDLDPKGLFSIDDQQQQIFPLTSTIAAGTGYSPWIVKVCATPPKTRPPAPS